MPLSKNKMPLVVGFCLALAACLTSGKQEPANQEAYVAEIQKFRQERDHRFGTSPFSQLAMVHREYLKDAPRVTIGTSPDADLRLEGEDVALRHAVVERTSTTPVLKAVEGTIWSLDDPPELLTELTLEDRANFRLGRFNLLYVLHPSWGRTFEVYDSEHAALAEFTGMDYFPIDPAYRVTATIAPHGNPEKTNLIDSQGNQRPYWVYGELHFDLLGTACQLELYAPSVEEQEIETHGFMLMFTDATSGKESYPAARYLNVEGRTSGQITVDFNKAYNPPCNYSPAFTCPFPRPQNRLPVAVRAGQKWYRKKTGEPAVKKERSG